MIKFSQVFFFLFHYQIDIMIVEMATFNTWTIRSTILFLTEQLTGIRSENPVPRKTTTLFCGKMTLNEQWLSWGMKQSMRREFNYYSNLFRWTFRFISMNPNRLTSTIMNRSFLHVSTQPGCGCFFICAVYDRLYSLAIDLVVR